MAMAGMAIGLGNIWRFPYMMGAFGGVWFLAAYLGFVLLLGIPALMCDWTLGRATRRGPIGAFEYAGLPGGRFWGYLLGVTIFMAASYYVVVIGWVARYALVFAIAGGPELPPKEEFEVFAGSFGEQLAYVWPCLLLGCASLHFGVRRGIERISKVVTPLFLAVFVFLAIRILTLDIAWPETLAHLSSLDQFSARTILAALGQSVFSLALGGTTMVIYGS